MPSRKKYSCKFPGCGNAYFWSTGEGDKIANKRFFRFPNNSDISTKWKRICNIDISINSRNMYVCEAHFREEDFINHTKHRLNPNVLPKNIEIEQNSIPREMNSFQNDPVDYNNCNPSNNNKENVNIIQISLICNDSCGNPSGVNTCDMSTSVLVDTAPTETPVFENSIFQNNEFSNNDNSPDNLTRSFHKDALCICAKGDCTDKNCSTHDSQLGDESYLPLKKRKAGFLTETGITAKNMSPRKCTMYQIHRKITQQLCKVQKKLKDKKNVLLKLKAMHDRKEFDCIASKLNDVTSQFINSQLRNVDRAPVGRRWTEQDKTFALSMYKRSPRLYKYLTNYFLLPSSRTLKHILSKIPFDTGMNSLLLEQLKIKTAEMEELDRYCIVAFDEIFLNSGYHYEAHKEQISGYEDLGELGRTSKEANHALVFMIRGLRRSWKQVIAYYFTADTISCSNLKLIIKIVISQLQGIGLKVKGTVCDQGLTQRRALSELCAENKIDPTPYTFVVNQQTIVTIYDVPHLLKCTRNCLLRCKIIFSADKVAKFQYIKNAFDVEQNYPFKLLYKLTKNDFNFADSFIKMRVKVAARQLSHTVAATIHTRSITNVNGLFPVESIQTAEFAQLIDDLFDSLNGYTLKSDDGKIYRCCLQDDSPHISLWNKLLPQLATWR